MSRALLDTSVVIAFLRNDPIATRQVLACENPSLPLFVIAELLGGVRRSRNPDATRRQLDEFILSCDVLLPDVATAEVYAEIDVELRRAGRPLPVHDVWLAALARQHHLPLATRDAHFQDVAGLQLLSW